MCVSAWWIQKIEEKNRKLVSTLKKLTINYVCMNQKVIIHPRVFICCHNYNPPCLNCKSHKKRGNALQKNKKNYEGWKIARSYFTLFFSFIIFFIPLIWHYWVCTVYNQRVLHIVHVHKKSLMHSENTYTVTETWFTCEMILMAKKYSS